VLVRLTNANSNSVHFQLGYKFFITAAVKTESLFKIISVNYLSKYVRYCDVKMLYSETVRRQLAAENLYPYVPLFSGEIFLSDK
jgi:hypothetical protein